MMNVATVGLELVVAIGSGARRRAMSELEIERHYLDTHAAAGGRDMADVSAGCLRTTAG